MADFSIALGAQAPKMTSYGDLVAMRDQAEARRNAMALQQQVMQQNAMAQQKARTTEDSMRNALRLAQTGDYAGAEQQYGLGAGNVDVHSTLAKLQDEHRARVHDKLAAVAPVAMQALKIADPSKRAALFQAAAPQLTAHGWSVDDIAKFPVTDEALTGAITNAQSADEAMKAYAKDQEGYTLTPGSARFVGTKQIANVPQLEKVTYLKQPDGSFIPVPVNMPNTSGAPTGGGVTGGAGKAWAPLSDNKPDSVINKVGLIAKKAGVDPNAPLSQEQFLALDMTQLEGGAQGKNNFGNMKNTDGSWKQFNSPADYQASQRAWLQRRWNEGYRTTAEAVAGKGAKVDGAGGSIQIGQPIGGKKAPAAEATKTPLEVANEIKHLYALIEDAHEKGHILSEDQSWVGQRLQEARVGRTWLPGGTAEKTSLDNIDKSAKRIMRSMITKGTSQTLRTNVEQQNFLQSVGGGDSTYQTRVDAIRSLAQNLGIDLPPPRKGGTAAAPTNKSSLPDDVRKQYGL